MEANAVTLLTSQRSHRINRRGAARWNPNGERGDAELAKIRRHDANHRVSMAVEKHGSADDIGSAAEYRLPSRVTENHDGMRIRRGVFIDGERAAPRSASAERREEICGGHLAENALGASTQGEIKPDESPGRDMEKTLLDRARTSK